MAAQNGRASGTRCHIVLVPGFGGFDALGRVEYYAGTTHLFQLWKKDQKSLPAPVVLHYFDNLPTAAVTTRAERLRKYLAKRMARGEILTGDRVVLAGHSTGGLDIRQLVHDLHQPEHRVIPVDGGVSVKAEDIRHCLRGVVFLSVPHWGTNIADWVHSHWLLRKTVIADLRAALAGSQLYMLDRIEAGIASGAACLTGADLLLALRDAMTEADERLCGRDPSRLADAQEAASELELYFRHMATDFRVIDDLTSKPYEGVKSPAHFRDEDRAAERKLWNGIETVSYATVGGRPFRFRSPSGCPAPEFDPANPFAWGEIVKGGGVSAGTDISYRLCYRACAGGPFKRPELAGAITRVMGPHTPAPLELWDNDGIVNTISMLWPWAETTLVPADHLDIVGHFRRTPAPPPPGGAVCEPPRAYLSYDSLKSAPLFAPRAFKDVWEEIFLFAAMPKAFHGSRRARLQHVALASPAAEEVAAEAATASQ